MLELKNTQWEMLYQKKNVIDLRKQDPPIKGLSYHGDPIAYKYMDIPLNESGWVLAPTDRNGNLNFNYPSRITGYNNSHQFYYKVDFTFFRTFIDIPKDALNEINSFEVTIHQVDDGARMYLIHDSEEFRQGMYIPSNDGKLNGREVTSDFTKAIKRTEGGKFTVMIVQFDDCPTGNKLTGGIDIKVNGSTISRKPYKTGDILYDGGIVFKVNPDGESGLVAYKQDSKDTLQWQEAKEYCEGLGTGWQLPSKDELKLMYTNLRKKDLGEFETTRYDVDYWSSTEIDKSTAWSMTFDYGSGCKAAKIRRGFVRAVRAF